MRPETRHRPHQSSQYDAFPSQVRDHTTTTFLFFSWTLIQSCRIQLQNICQHLTNWTRWIKRDKVSSSATSLFKWRFGSCSRRCCLSSLNRDLKIRQRRRQWEHHKSNRFNWQNNNFPPASSFFCRFLCRHCTTTTWKCLISRCTEEVHKRRRNFLSLSASWLWFLGIQL